MSTEGLVGCFDEELYRQLTLEYPDRCQSCDRVASTIVLLMVRGSRTEEEVRSAVSEDADLISNECSGLQARPDGGGCFGSPYNCGRQDSTEIVN